MSRRSLSGMIAVALTFACYGGVRGPTVATAVDQHPDLTLIRKNGSSVTLTAATIVGDSVVGSSVEARNEDGSPRRIAVALDDIARTDPAAADSRMRESIRLGTRIGIGLFIVLGLLLAGNGM